MVLSLFLGCEVVEEVRLKDEMEKSKYIYLNFGGDFFYADNSIDGFEQKAVMLDALKCDGLSCSCKVDQATPN